MQEIIITEETFLKFGFRDPAPGPWIVAWHTNLTRFDEYRKTIILGICEVLVGAGLQGRNKGKHRGPVDLPGDFDQHGCFDCDIDYDKKTVFVRNMFTSENPVQYFTVG